MISGTETAEYHVKHDCNVNGKCRFFSEYKYLFIQIFTCFIYRNRRVLHHQMICLSVSQSVSQSGSQVSQSVNNSVPLSVNQSVFRSVSQSVNQVVFFIAINIIIAIHPHHHLYYHLYHYPHYLTDPSCCKYYLHSLNNCKLSSSSSGEVSA